MLSCYDLTRPIPSPSAGCQSPHSTLYSFNGHTDVKELAMYVQDTSPNGTGLSIWEFAATCTTDSPVATQAEPRLGVSYNVQKTNTDSSRLLCPHPGNSVQRESGAFQHGVQFPSPRR